MKKKLIVLSSLGFMLPVLALAQMTPPAGVNSGAPRVGSLQQIIVSLENVAALIFGAMAVIMFVFAGIRFLTAGGEPEKVQQARAAFLWGIAGVVVGIIAFSIIAIVGSFITVAPGA